MLNTVIVGASGYAGAELAALVQNHPQLKLFGLYVRRQPGRPQALLFPASPVGR
jgi:N-acetyl-gamma-glutamylphosphate reductase